VLERFERNTTAAMITARNAQNFALSHLNDDATICYAIDLLHQYQRLFDENESSSFKLHPDAMPIIGD
jgi:hypothetical protein